MQFKKTLEIKADHKLIVIDVADILYFREWSCMRIIRYW